MVSGLWRLKLDSLTATQYLETPKKEATPNESLLGAMEEPLHELRVGHAVVTVGILGHYEDDIHPYIYIHIYIYMHPHLHIYIYVHVYIYIMYVSIYIYVYMYIYVLYYVQNIYIYIHIELYRVCTRCIAMYICIFIYHYPFCCFQLSYIERNKQHEQLYKAQTCCVSTETPQQPDGLILV